MNEALQLIQQMLPNKFRVPTLHSYCCYVPQAIIFIGVKKRIAAEFVWGFAMIEHTLYFKSCAIEET